MKFRIDTISFILGMAVASVIWWVVAFTRPMLENFIETWQQKKKERSQRASSALEDAHRKTLYKQTQTMHLTASLFPLDEILEIPRLLAPPIIHEPNSPRSHVDIVETAIPFLPNYPELGTFYGAPTISINQALSGNRNLVIIGQPGAGKTTTLAYLASQISNRSADLQAHHHYIPFLIHAADLGLPLTNPKKPEDFLAPIADKLGQVAGVFDAARIPGFVQYSFTSGRALLLIDGVDELPQTGIQEVSAFIRVILRQYPKIRIITTGAPEYVDGILSLGFAPLSIMPWTSQQQSNFLNKWTALWQKYVESESWARSNVAPIDSVLLNRWLETDNSGLTPFEFTLKIWGAYAGDTRGARGVDAIETHFRRLLPPGLNPEAAITIGSQASLQGVSIFDERRAIEWTRAFETIDKTAPGENAAPEIDSSDPEHKSSESAILQTKPGTKTTASHRQAADSNVISKLAATGLLTIHAGNRFRFSHPIFQGYLAGKGLDASTVGNELLKQPAWSGQTTTLRYLAAFSDATHLVNELLAAQDPILMRPQLIAARLLRDAPREAPWRGTVMSTLVQILSNEDHPLGLRGQALSAFAFSGDTSASPLFRQLMRAPYNELRQLASLGSGIMRDTKAVEGLIDVVNHSSSAARHAACLALVSIGSSQALEEVAKALLHGDEELRVIAAEALANHSGDGREALREGITSDDILLRRAIVYGLGRVPEPLAMELIEKTQVNDEQWAVRSVASEIINMRNTTDIHVPMKLSVPSETPWLIEYAGKYGMGISPGQPATDILLLAIRNGDPEYIRPSLNYLRNTSSENVFADLYPYIFSRNEDAREAIFQVLSEYALAGVTLPPPQKFGLG